MGSRAAFVDVNMNDFTFKAGGQLYQSIGIDLQHDHKGVRPHRHEYLSHGKNDPGVPPTAAEMAVINRIKKEFGLQ